MSGNENRDSRIVNRKKAKPNKRVTPRAASFKRIAKTLRVLAAAYRRQATTDAEQAPRHCYLKASILRDIASELDNEAATLRAMP